MYLFSAVYLLYACVMIVGMVCELIGQGDQHEHKDIHIYRKSKDYKKPEIHVRFVSKGVNPQQITSSLIDIQASVNNSAIANLADWIVEVVTDNWMELGPENNVVNQIVVPSDQVTPQNTLFKARALHQAAVSVGTDTDAWILHMDEESQFDVPNGLKVFEFCDSENQLIRYMNQKPSFANGCITYFKNNRMFSFVISLCDCIRIAEDTHKMKWTFTAFNQCQMGIKGSNWIIHSAIERHLGFDVGTKRSVGEDWAVSMTYNNQGQPIKWYSATIEEQSPFNITDFRKQRNRWQKAIFLNALNSPELNFKLKFFMFYNILIFFGAPIVITSTILFWSNTISYAQTGHSFSPILRDDFQAYIVIFTTSVQQQMQVQGLIFSGMHRVSQWQFALALIIMLSGVGNIIASTVENYTLLQFMLVVDKFKLEFKVIKKDVDIKDEAKMKLNSNNNKLENGKNYNKL